MDPPPRAPIAETVTRNGPPGSDNGLSRRESRHSNWPNRNRRARTLSRSDSSGVGNMFPSDEDSNLSGQSRLSANSFNSANDGKRLRKSRDHSLLPKFLTRPEIRPPRAAVSREADYVRTKKRGGRDFLENTADSIGASADHDGDGSGAKSNRVKELTVFGLRGFGEFKPRVATGLYGGDLYEPLLHIAHNGTHRLWNLGLRFPIAQRIAKCASLGFRGSMSMGTVGGGDILLLADFPPWGEANFTNYRMSDVKTAKWGAEPHTVAMCVRSAKLRSRYFAAIQAMPIWRNGETPFCAS